MFDAILVTCVGCSNLAGMIVGARSYEIAQRDAGYSCISRKIIGIDVSGKDVLKQRQLGLEIIQRTAKLVDVSVEENMSLGSVNIDDRWSAAVYGCRDHGTTEAIQDVARLEGIIVDPVYTGKGLRGAMEDVNSGEGRGNGLFVRTGGQTVLLVYGGVEDDL